MSHDWFKMHNDFINDPKMKRYFTKAERLDWVNLLCLSSKSRERGVLAIPDDEISYALDLEDDEWLALREKLIDRKMLAIREADDALIVINWAERQYDKPSDTPTATAERKRRSRAAQPVDVVPDVTPMSRPVTPVSRPVTPCHATDKIREERENTPYIPQEGEGVVEAAPHAMAADAEPDDPFGFNNDPVEPLPPPPSRTQRARATAQRRDEVVALYQAFRAVRLGLPETQPIPSAEYDKHSRWFSSILDAGGTPTQVRLVVDYALRTWSEARMVTPKSISEQWSSLLVECVPVKPEPVPASRPTQPRPLIVVYPDGSRVVNGKRIAADPGQPARPEMSFQNDNAPGGDPRQLVARVASRMAEGASRLAQGDRVGGTCGAH